MIQRAMHDLQGGDEDHDGDPEFACEDGEHELLEEHEASEILNTML